MKFSYSKWRLFGANAVLVGLVGCLVYSGFAYPLHYGSGLWPWNRDWFMFSYDTGYDYELQALSQGADGRPTVLDVSSLFSFAVGAAGNRFQEVPRDDRTMQALAKYLCAHLAIPWVTLNDVAWARGSGRRLPLSEVPESQRSNTVWVEHYVCGT